MKKNLTFVSTSNMSKQDWLDYRMTGIGASEIASVMGLSPYLSAHELLYQKIGIFPNNSIDNAATHWGKVLESVVAEQWQYWGGNLESLIQNYNSGNVVRKCQRVNSYVRNPEMPHLFVSLDRLILPKYNNGVEGALEIKTISGYAADKWESGIPIYYLAQLQTQLLVTGMRYGELAMLKDGRNLEVLKFEYMEDVCTTILNASADFWNNRVLPARAVLESMELATEDEKILAVQAFEPEPDGSDAYKAFLAKKFSNPNADDKVDGQQEHYALALEIQRMKAEVKNTTNEISAMENTIKAALGNASTMDFGSAGRITYKADKKGIRSLKINLK